MELTTISINDIMAWIKVRNLTEDGVDRLRKNIEARGYNTRFPIAVSRINGGYRGLDGNHRYEALRRLGEDMVLAQIYENLSEEDEYRIAYDSNKGHDLVVRQLWVDDAEFIWRLLDQGKTQAQVGEILGWSRSQIGQYNMLRSVCPEAWQIVNVTTKSSFVTNGNEDVVTSNVTTVTFTEGLLRPITCLTPDQQLELVKALANGKIDKPKFNQLAEKYKIRNAIQSEAETRLKGLPADYLERALEEINKGICDKEYQANKTVGPIFEKLIKALLDEYAQHTNYQLFVASVSELINQLEPDSVDVIITDPPYKQEYLPVYGDLAKLAAKVLKPGGSLVTMTGQSYLPEIFSLMTPHIKYHWMTAYLTPGGQSVQLWQRQVNTFWKPIIWYVKGDYTGKWLGDVAKSAVNDNDKRFHEWGQSESGMADLIERFSNLGDTILDPFLGGGTTAIVAIQMGRKFIGSDIDPEKIETTQKRLANSPVRD